MNIITKEEFKELINFHASPCVTIYIPTHRSGIAVNEKQDPIIFKNALQNATATLKSQGLSTEVIENLLKQGMDLYKNEVFWNSQLDGLAVFIAEDFFKVIQLPIGVSEKVYVNSTFFVTPLLPVVIKNEEFNLLVLSKHDAKFYQGTEFGLQRVEVKGLPNGMDDVVHFEEKEDEQLFRRGGGGAGERSASSHGHAEGQLDDKANIGIYFQEVDRTLFSEVLHDKNVPLILAGVEYLIPIYKATSKYKYIVEEAITGSQERESSQTLFEKSRTLLKPYFEARTKSALKNYYTQIATANTSSMPEKVIPASFYAQISDLFVVKDTHLWGKFNEADNKLEIHAEKQEGDVCLLNQAAAKTFINGGNVYLLEKEQMPKDSIIAASFRFQ